jgi:hypothetical protein
MIKAVPEFFNQLVSEHNSSLRVAGQAGDKLDQTFHNHGLVVYDLLALDLALRHLDQGFDI